MFIPAKDGKYYNEEGLLCTDYNCFVDTFHRVIELYALEDGSKWVCENEWPEMNDIEKYVCRQRGWNLDQYFE